MPSGSLAVLCLQVHRGCQAGTWAVLALGTLGLSEAWQNLETSRHLDADSAWSWGQLLGEPQGGRTVPVRSPQMCLWGAGEE